MKRFNIDEFLWFLILLGFTFYFYYLLLTGRINNFISPRMNKYVVFSLVGFGLLTLYQFTKIFTIRGKRSLNKSYIFLFITLIIGFWASEKGINSSIIEKKGINLANNTITKTRDKLSNMEKEVSDQYDEESLLEFNEDNYLRLLGEIGNNLEKYKGRKVSISGFVYKEKEFKKDEFIVARLMMSCCAADSQVLGLMSKWPKAHNLGKEEWVRIEGKISSILYWDKDLNKNTIIPILIVDSLEKIEKPDKVYIINN